MRVAVVQYDIAWEDKGANHARVEGMLAEAALDEDTFVLLPELGDTGFSFDLDEIVDDRTTAWGRDLAIRLRCWLQVGYARRGPEGRGRNCAAIFGPDGTVLGTYEKVHPFSFGREAQYYEGGDRIIVRRCGEAAVSPMICYDLRFPELWRHAALAGAGVFSIGANWPASRHEHWRTLLRARAIENQAFVVAANRTGRDPTLAYAGGSMIISPTGETIAEAGPDATVLQATLDLDALAAWRRTFPALADAKRILLGIGQDPPARPILTDHNGCDEPSIDDELTRGGP